MDQGAGRWCSHRPRKFYQALIGDLFEYAEAEFQLGVRQPDGATLREHLENLQRQKGFTHELLQAPDCPDSAWYLWEYFLRLSMRRTSNGYSPNPITNEEVRAWSGLFGIALAPFELEALEGLETRYLLHYAKEFAPSGGHR